MHHIRTSTRRMARNNRDLALDRIDRELVVIINASPVIHHMQSTHPATEVDATREKILAHWRMLRQEIELLW